MLLISGSLGGCQGFAHVDVVLPPLEVQLDIIDAKLQGGQIDLVRPAYYGEPEAFVDLVKAPVPGDGVLYDWRRVLVKEGYSIRLVFPRERRHIGVPSFLPLRPSAKTMRRRTVFVRLDYDGDLYRVSVFADNAAVNRASLPEVRANLPSALSGIRPEPRSPDLMPWIETAISFYGAVRWTSAARVAVSGLQRRSELDILSLRVAGETVR
jgi:hypothetical protein